MTAYLCQVMCSSEEQAIRIARAAVGEGLAAAANIVGPTTSFFRWQGELRTVTETLLLLKTVARRRRALVARIAALHSYQCPSIVLTRIADAYAPYLDWLDQSTAEEATS